MVESKKIDGIFSNYSQDNFRTWPPADCHEQRLSKQVFASFVKRPLLNAEGCSRLIQLFVQRLSPFVQ